MLTLTLELTAGVAKLFKHKEKDFAKRIFKSFFTIL